MTDLEQLRADLAVLERYDKRQGTIFIRSVREEIERKIAQLEADADPWREAKNAVGYFRGFAKHRSETDVVKLVDHLTAENKRLAARVAELEAGCDVLKRQHDHVFDDRERLKKRVAELERSAKAPPVSLKRADEIHVGDSILGGGKICTISEVYIHHRERKVRLSDGFWSMLVDPGTLVAVVNGAMDEGETCPLKKGCDDGK